MVHSLGSTAVVAVDMQGTKFVADFYTFSLGGCDVVMGGAMVVIIGSYTMEFC